MITPPRHRPLPILAILFWIIAVPFSDAGAGVDSLPPIVHYEFAGTLEDTLRASTLTAFGVENDGHNRNNATSEFGEDEYGTFWSWTSTLPRGGGFRIDIDRDISASYSIGVRFAFDQTRPGYRKIIDYKNSASDNGFYFYRAGNLTFYPYGTLGQTAVANNQVVDVVATRSAEGVFSAYLVIDGVHVLELQVDDARGEAVPAVVDGRPRFGFFFDDIRTGSEATSGGRVYSIRVWDHPITDAQVGTAMDRRGTTLALSGLEENETVQRPRAVEVAVTPGDQAQILRLEAWLNNRLIESSRVPPFVLPIHWPGLAPDEEHRLAVRVLDSEGRVAELERRFRVSGFFGLTPEDGSLITGAAPVVSWQQGQFGPARVRYRPVGTGSDGWVEVTGAPGTHPAIRLPELTAEGSYEFQPFGATGEPGPIQRFTRVRGLAFTQPSHAATIERDYDQRLGIRVRNNSSETLYVRLEAGQPEDPDLLASFVGSGSEDRPFPLPPRSERSFQFTVSAQNVDTEHHRIPIRIVADSGASDSSEILLHVRQPHVELEWTELGPSPDGLGRMLRLTNRGDTVTDLAIRADDPHALVISPSMAHGLLRPRQSLDFQVTPRFFEGFSGIEADLVATGAGQDFTYAYRMELPPGESIHRVWLAPELASSDARTAEVLETRRSEAARVGPAALDWSQATPITDTTGTGQLGRWRLSHDDIEWTGSDGSGDGAIDHVSADVGRDGRHEYAAVLHEGEWHPTNIVEAWLEMDFALRGSRDSYQPHTVQVVLNDTTIGLLEDMLPEGNFRFPIPVTALRFDGDGQPAGNQVGLRTTHLRGGHYAVNSDFRFKFRLAATPTFAPGSSPAEASRRAAESAGISLNEPDFSVSAAEVVIEGPDPLNAGDEITIRFPVRNLGAISASNVPVELQRILPGGRRETVGSTLLSRVGVDELALGNITWKIPGGDSNLALVVDPEEAFGDPDRVNNQAMFRISATGASTPPTVDIVFPRPGARVDRSVLPLELHVAAETGEIVAMISINQGLWHEQPAQPGRLNIPLLVQPGEQTVDIQIIDASGQITTDSVSFRVDVPSPAARILSPPDGARVPGPDVQLEIEVPDGVALAAARAAHGVWHRASVLGQRAEVAVPLRPGQQRLTVMVADHHGVVRTLEQDITRIVEPTSAENLAGSAASEYAWLWPLNHPDLEIDLFSATTGVLRGLDLSPGQRAERLWADARRRQAQGDFRGALNLYRDSLMLQPDEETQDRVKRLEAYLRLQ